jgi:hypothetical protein
MSGILILDVTIVVVLLINQKDYELIIIEGLKSVGIRELADCRIDA